jgi:hypothetical protein
MKKTKSVKRLNNKKAQKERRVNDKENKELIKKIICSLKDINKS